MIYAVHCSRHNECEEIWTRSRPLQAPPILNLVDEMWVELRYLWAEQAKKD